MPEPAGILVRRLFPDDWEEFRRIRLRALRDSPRAFSATLEESRRLPEDEWRRRLGSRAQFIAVIDRQPVGTAGGIDEGGGAQLISMWVEPRARGSGVGSRLVAAVAEWARERGHTALCLWVVEGNLAAEGLYLRNGFIRTGRSQPVESVEPPRREFEMRLAL